MQYATESTVFTFAPERPNSPNRNGNFATFPVTTTGEGFFACEGISRIIAFNTQVAVSQAFCAASNASATAYGDGLQSGDNDGSGFSAWTSFNPASNNGFAGSFVASSTGNGDGDNNGDKDIDTGASPNNRAWGFYANTSNVSEATRPFTVPLTVGATFSLKMDNVVYNKKVVL